MGSDIRRLLQHGDPTSNKGMLIGTSDSTNHGQRMAVEGDFATCPKCGVGGPVFNDCDPRWTDMGKSVLVEGARVCCQCADKPFVIATQNVMTTVVGVRQPVAGYTAFAKSAGIPDAFNKMTPGAAAVTAAYDSDPTMICPNMTNAEFLATMRYLRDKAVRLLTDRIAELDRWSAADQDKVELWFGKARPDTRRSLRDGLARIREIMGGLRDRNFERETPEALARVGCVPRAKEGERPSTASVCKPDGTYTIFIGRAFCAFASEENSLDGVPFDKDSKLTALIHEVSHFPEAMDSEDHWYSVFLSKTRARMRDEFCISNADNISYYVANIPNWGRGEPVWQP